MTETRHERSPRHQANLPSILRAVIGLAVLATLGGSATYMGLAGTEQFLPTDRVAGVVTDRGVSRDADGDETYWTRFLLTSGDEVRTSGRRLYNGTARGTQVQIELGQLTSRVMGVQWHSNGTDVRDGNGSLLILSLTGVFGVAFFALLVGALRFAEAGRSRRWQLFAVVTGIIVTIAWQMLTTPTLGPL